MSNLLGLKELNARFQAPELRSELVGMFPRDNSNDVRFAINFYTSIGLGGLTWGREGAVMRREELRKTLEALRARKAKQ